MSSSAVENLNVKDNRWYRIISELLSIADISINGSRPYDIRVNNPDFYKNVLQKGSLGLGESYMDGWWDCERLDIFFERIIGAGLENHVPRQLKDCLRVLIARIANHQSKRRSLIVGKEHYDLGNDLFTRILDPFMQYSCGYWKDAKSLDHAQENKLRLICEKLQLRPGMTLLDIGCGWGGLSEYAARLYGVKVHGVTISAEQQKMAQARCAGLDVTILLQDYRNLSDKYDRIVSVGMFEHVGPKNYQTYFDVVKRNLKPEGLFLLHTIGSGMSVPKADPWIDKYIFPNGCLPSIRQIAEATEGKFVMEDWQNLSTDYDLTLMAWYHRFQKAWPDLKDNYSERFERMFTYYLNVCAGGFRARDLQLWQVVFSPQGVAGGIRVPR